MKEESVHLLEHAKGVAKEWLEMSGNHQHPVVHYREPDGCASASIMPLHPTITQEEAHRRVGNTLQKLVREGYDEFTLSYEGIWRETGQRVLVTVYYSQDEERTWFAVVDEIDGKPKVGDWQEIAVLEGEVHGIFYKANFHLWN